MGGAPTEQTRLDQDVRVGRNPGRTTWLLAAATVLAVAALLAAALAADVANGRGHHPAPTATNPTLAGGVHVDGSYLVDAAGQPLRLDGVGRSGSEFECLGGHHVFSGPTDLASVDAMLRWHIDAVRIPLNEDCWLGIGGLGPATSGSAYQAAIGSYVRLLQQHGMVVDLDLHWTSPGTGLANSQQQMADADHAPDLWRQVATAYRNDPYVVFELYNEPYGVSWKCWRNGCQIPASDGKPTYRAAGMQQLVDVVRATGARNPILLDGLQHASNFSGWRLEEPHDPASALVAAWHIYGPTSCNASCWTSTMVDMRGSPILVTEFGETDCNGTFVDRLMSWLDAHRIGYIAWAWDTWAGCSGPSLIASDQGKPHGRYGNAVMAHYQSEFP